MPDITITVESFKLHYGEKVSTGEFENAQVDLSLEGSIDGAEVDSGGLPYDVRGRLLRSSKQLQKDGQKAAENRLKLPEQEDWTPE